MPGAEISNVGSYWSNGILYFTDSQGTTLLSLANSTQAWCSQFKTWPRLVGRYW